MKENKIIISKEKSLETIAQIQLNEESSSKKESLFLKKIALNDFLPKNLNDEKKSSQSSINFSKAQTKSRDFDKRFDIFGNLITQGGKHKVTFIDRISNKNFIEYINVEKYKEYNKMEEITLKNMNGCCVIV